MSLQCHLNGDTLHNYVKYPRTSDKDLAGTHQTRRETCFLVKPRLLFTAISSLKKWWSWTGSNRRPEACKATALPTELQPLEKRDPPTFRHPR